MTTPSIADVKAAAEDLQRDLSDAMRGDFTPTTESVATLVDFALSILNAPGLSAERLDEIQRLEQSATNGPWNNAGETVVNDSGRIADVDDPDRPTQYSEQRSANADFIADARQSVPELLSEVLRLRSGAHYLVAPPSLLTPEESDRLRREFDRVFNGPGSKSVVRFIENHDRSDVTLPCEGTVE